MISINDVGGILAARTPVHGTDGKIGSVGQVFLDDASGDPTWLTVNTGLFGTKESFVPLEGASYQGDEIAVPFDKDTVKNAPRVDVDESLTPDQESELFAHYGVQGRYADGWDQRPEAQLPTEGEPQPAAAGVPSTGAQDGAGVPVAGGPHADVPPGEAPAPAAATPDAGPASPQRAAEVPGPDEERVVEQRGPAPVPIPTGGPADGVPGRQEPVEPAGMAAPATPPARDHAAQGSLAHEPSAPAGHEPSAPAAQVPSAHEAPAGAEGERPTGRVRLRRYTVTETYAEDGTVVTNEDIHIERDPGTEDAPGPGPADDAQGRHARP